MLMEVKLVEDVVVINLFMKNIFLLILLFVCGLGFCQDDNKDKTYKKRVLESIEIDFLTSYYSQEGSNASVTGGIGNEDLEDFSPTIVVSIPINDDDVISLDLGISTYTSASSRSTFWSSTGPYEAGGRNNQNCICLNQNKLHNFYLDFTRHVRCFVNSWKFFIYPN